MNLPVFLFAVIGVLLSGCAHRPMQKESRKALPLPPTLAALSSYERTAIVVLTDIVVREESSYTVREVKFLSFVPSAGTNKVLKLHVYIPRGATNVPVALILPMSGGESIVERYQARSFAKHRIAAVILQREKDRRANNVENVNALFCQSVLDEKRVIDWIETQPEFDKQCIGVVGTSMGGIKATPLAASDSRPRAFVIGLAGGDVPHILAHSSEKRIRARVHSYLDRHKMTIEEFKKSYEGKVVWDPKTVAPFVESKKVMMILARCDTVVPYEKGHELWRALGRPEAIFLPAGHYSAALFLPYIQKETLHFFERRFKDEADALLTEKRSP